jgi:GNAT superfamily N-acetyltransferase
MAEKLTIRFASIEDAPLVMRLIRELAVYEKMIDEVVATEDTLREWVFEKKSAEVLLAEWEGEAIGYALFFHSFSTFVGRAGMYLEDIYVRPEMRGRGIGKALFLRVAELAAERGCGRMEWSCLDWNQSSIDFYLSMGAVAMKGWTVYRLAGDALQSLAE